MSLTVSETASGTFEPCPAGSYMARCVRIIDLGTQETEFQGKTLQQKKALLSWEVLDEEARRDDGEPFLLSKRYTASLHEKAALRKDLASWRGRDFSPEELAGFNLKNVLGRECFLSVVHVEKDGKTFANIAAIMKLPKGATAPEGCGQEELLLWDMSAPDWEVFAKLPKRTVEQIEASPEFKALKQPASVPMGTDTAASTSSTPFDDMDDDLPF